MKKWIIICLVALVIIGVVLILFFYKCVYIQSPKITIQKIEYKPQATVTAQGARAGVNQLKVAVPAKALPTGATVEVKKATALPSVSLPQHYASDVYEVKTSAKLTAPAIIEIAFDKKKVPADKLNNLFAAYWDGSKWVPAKGGVIDLNRSVVMVKTDHFSLWAALYDAVSGVWDDRVDDVQWTAMPSELRDKIKRDWGIQQANVKAALHAQFSSITKGSTFVFGIANQLVDVTGILGGLEGGGDLAKAVIETVAEKAAQSGGGEMGKLTVTLYETAKTGLAVGTVLGHLVLDLGLKTAQVQSATVQILGWVLEKEMAYFNANTSQLFEYLSLYDSSWGQRLDTYIIFYDAPASGRLRNRGVLLYHWSPQYKQWQRGKNVSVTSEAILDVFKTSAQNVTVQKAATTPVAQPASTVPAQPKTPSFAKNNFPSSLLGLALFQNQEMSFAVGCLENASVQKSYQAVYGDSDIIVNVNKFSNSSASQGGPQKCVDWDAKTLGVKTDLVSKNSINDYRFWVTYGPFNGQNRALSGSFVSVGDYLVDMTINKNSLNNESSHRAIAETMIKALIK